ncbi:putative MFS family arabinose efflux permease [Luteimonas cucumeris]|uniref:Putative MFS family arabinose efflux permease n=1 Tax=Luteimonas cucumeris TaxID=985012 RepID=A0A562L090_9GAMM|nr:MFS transporter [Luteimonas cucumeris]TWI01013.1 putative MFS family arabinose efflux permease [Luteimonas cucumeris]
MNAIDAIAAGRQRPFDRRDAKTLALSALGGALEFYDFVVFVFFTKTLGVLFFPPDTAPWLSQLQVYGIFAVGYLARPLGGVVMAHFGDLVGRKRMFTLSVFLMSVPTLLIGLLPTYAQIGLLAPLLLLLLRVVQGIAVGGEVPGAWVFVAEHVPPRRVGFACASLTSGLTAGILIGSLLAAWINSRFTPEQVQDFVWRVPFLLGGVFGFIAVYLRRWLHETPVFTEMRERKQLASRLPLREVLANHRGSVLLSMLATWMLTAAIVVVVLMTPTLVQSSFQLPAALAFHGNSIATLCLVIGCLVAGLAADRFGMALALLVGAAGLAASTYALYLHLATGDATHFIALYALAGFFTGVVAVVPTVMVAAFPARVRFSGLSFSYNVAYAIFGGLTPPLIGYLSQTVGGLAPAHYVALTSAIGMAVALYLLRRPLS